MWRLQREVGEKTSQGAHDQVRDGQQRAAFADADRVALRSLSGSISSNAIDDDLVDDGFVTFVVDMKDNADFFVVANIRQLVDGRVDLCVDITLARIQIEQTIGVITDQRA